VSDEFIADTCDLALKIKEWRIGLKDKTRCDRVVKALVDIAYGANDEQLRILKIGGKNVVETTRKP
jgi:hypothetical protein